MKRKLNPTSLNVNGISIMKRLAILTAAVFGVCFFSVCSTAQVKLPEESKKLTSILFTQFKKKKSFASIGKYFKTPGREEYRKHNTLLCHKKKTAKKRAVCLKEIPLVVKNGYPWNILKENKKSITMWKYATEKYAQLPEEARITETSNKCRCSSKTASEPLCSCTIEFLIEYRDQKKRGFFKVYHKPFLGTRNIFQKHLHILVPPIKVYRAIDRLFSEYKNKGGGRILTDWGIITAGNDSINCHGGRGDMRCILTSAEVVGKKIVIWGKTDYLKEIERGFKLLSREGWKCTLTEKDMRRALSGKSFKLKSCMFSWRKKF